MDRRDKTESKPWYRFFDANKKFDYKSLYNAIIWAERRVRESRSHEIKILRMHKYGRTTELEGVARVIYNRPQKERVVEGIEEDPTPVILSRTRGSITVAWRDIDVYHEYKDKESWASSEKRR